MIDPASWANCSAARAPDHLPQLAQAVEVEGIPQRWNISQMWTVA